MAQRRLPTLLVVLVVLAVLMLLTAFTAAASNEAPSSVAGTSAPLSPRNDLQRLQDATGGTARVSTHRATGVASFVSLEPGSLNLGVAADASPEARAQAFFAQYGGLFGIQDAATELRLLGSEADSLGMTHLTYGQVYRDVPVWAALLTVHLDAVGDLRAVNGVFVPGLALNARPMLSANAANGSAIAAVAAQPYSDADEGPNSPMDPATLRVLSNKLVVYHAGLAQGMAAPSHLVYEVEVGNGTNVREFLYVDAQRGKVLNRYSAIHNGLNRRVYEQAFNPANLVWQEGQPFPGSLNQDQQNIVLGSGESYYFFFNAFGRDSYDAAGHTMDTVNNDPTIACPNANWNGTTTNYCNGVTSDDVVAHEWGHAYTEYTHNLIYQWQPGALNESYSDIWGETVDLINGRQTDVPGPNRTVGQCSSFSTGGGEASYRWLVGEDSTAFGGAIRDMWQPTCEGDPAEVLSTQYVCGTGDGGGVHSNSGVPNHAFALLVDGGTYNGQTVAPIGLVKAAHIYWRAQTLYQGPASYFVDHADGLEQACSDLRVAGTNLQGLSTTTTPAGPSGQTIAAADCAAVAAAMAAVEMRADATTQCNWQPLLNPNAPALCAGTANQPQTIQLTTFDSGLGSWTVENQGVYSGWPGFNWVVTSTVPVSSTTGPAAFARDPNAGSCSGGAGDFSGVQRLVSPVFTIPAGGTTPRLAFDHGIASERLYDGGNLQYKVNGGAWTLVPTSAFLFNPYNTTMAAAPGNTSPLAGQAGFTGSDGGRVDVRRYSQSQINLGALGVAPGNTIQFRYQFGMDGCGGLLGWYVDNVHLYSCSPAQTSVELAMLSTAPAPRRLPAELPAGGLLALSVGMGLLLRRRRQ